MKIPLILPTPPVLPSHSSNVHTNDTYELEWYIYGSPVDCIDIQLIYNDTELPLTSTTTSPSPNTSTTMNKYQLPLITYGTHVNLYELCQCPIYQQLSTNMYIKISNSSMWRNIQISYKITCVCKYTKSIDENDASLVCVDYEEPVVLKSSSVPVPVPVPDPSILTDNDASVCDNCVKQIESTKTQITELTSSIERYTHEYCEYFTNIKEATELYNEIQCQLVHIHQLQDVDKCNYITKVDTLYKEFHHEWHQLMDIVDGYEKQQLLYVSFKQKLEHIVNAWPSSVTSSLSSSWDGRVLVSDTQALSVPDKVTFTRASSYPTSIPTYIRLNNKPMEAHNSNNAVSPSKQHSNIVVKDKHLDNTPGSFHTSRDNKTWEIFHFANGKVSIPARGEMKIPLQIPPSNDLTNQESAYLIFKLDVHQPTDRHSYGILGWQSGSSGNNDVSTGMQDIELNIQYGNKNEEMIDILPNKRIVRSSTAYSATTAMTHSPIQSLYELSDKRGIKTPSFISSVDLIDHHPQITLPKSSKVLSQKDGYICLSLNSLYETIGSKSSKMLPLIIVLNNAYSWLNDKDVE